MKVDIRPGALDAPASAEVQIEAHDLLSMDQTLALIIEPALERFKKNIQGSPYVDQSDVPSDLHPPLGWVGSAGEVDPYWHARWQYVVNEMHWAFAAKLRGDAGADPTLEDSAAHRANQARMNNGFRLFGKYITCLWR